MSWHDLPLLTYTRNIGFFRSWLFRGSPLRNCDHCGSPGRALRKCVGCSLAGYCSKECQKAAWSQHESQSRDAIDWQNGDKIYVEKPTGGKFGGFANAHAFIHAINGFLDAHAWAFYTDARALVASRGSVEWLQSTPPKIVNTRLRPSFANPATQQDRNPSTPFKFESSSGITSTEYDRIVSTGSVYSWSSEAMTTARSNSLRKLQARFGAEFAGLIPVLVPSAEPRSRGSTLRVLGTDQQCVYPGRFGQELKKGKWRPLFEDWGEYDVRGRNAVINAALRKFTSGLFVANVILNVHSRL